MREIKFRAWDKSNNQWCNEDIYIRGDGAVMGDSNFLDIDDVDPKEYLIGVEISQFTGLKDIWEGDIGIDKFGRKVVVVWVDEFACFALETIDDVVKGEYNFSLSDFVEKIGNIYENPELLTK